MSSIQVEKLMKEDFLYKYWKYFFQSFCRKIFFFQEIKPASSSSPVFAPAFKLRARKSVWVFELKKSFLTFASQPGPVSIVCPLLPISFFYLTFYFFYFYFFFFLLFDFALHITTPRCTTILQHRLFFGASADFKLVRQPLI